MGDGLLGWAFPSIDHRGAIHLDTDSVIGFNVEDPLPCGHPPLGLADQPESVPGESGIAHGGKNPGKISW